MGVEVYANVEKFNKDTKEWEKKALYKKTSDGEFKEVYIFCGSRSSDFYSYFFEDEGAIDMRGIPEDVSKEVHDEWHLDEPGYYYHATWADYVELRLLSESPQGEIEVWDEEGEKKVNVIKPFYDEINKLVDAYDGYCVAPGQWRVILVAC